MADSGQTRMDPVTMKPYSVKLLDEGTIPARCDDLSKWVTTGSGSGVTKSLEHGICLNGHGAVRCDTTSGQIQMLHAPAAPVDWTGKTVALRFYLSDSAAFSSVRLFCISGASGTSHYYRHDLTAAARGTGWNTYVLQNSNFEITGTPDWANIRYWYINFVPTAAMPAYAILDHFAVDYPGPCIIIPTTDDTDDGIIDDYYPAAAAAGVKMTSFIIEDNIGAVGQLTAAELDTLYAAGWDVASHSQTHVDLSGVTEAEAIVEMEHCRDYLLGRGFDRSAHYFSWPFSVTNAALIALARSRYRAARHGASGKCTMHFPAYTDRNWYLPATGVDALSTAAVQALVDGAIATKTPLILYWHTLAAASFITEIDYIAAQVALGTCQTMTMSEYWTWLCHRYRGSCFWKTKQG